MQLGLHLVESCPGELYVRVLGQIEKKRNQGLKVFFKGCSP